MPLLILFCYLPYRRKKDIEKKSDCAKYRRRRKSSNFSHKMWNKSRPKASHVKGLEDKPAEFGQPKRRFFFRSHRGRHGRLVAVDWLASIQYTGSNRSAETVRERARPRFSYFVALPRRLRERIGRKKKDVRIIDTRLYVEMKAYNRNIEVWRWWKKLGEKVCEFGKGKSGSEGRCRIDTRPYTEKRCYSRYAKNSRTIAVIREREREEIQVKIGEM